LALEKQVVGAVALVALAQASLCRLASCGFRVFVIEVQHWDLELVVPLAAGLEAFQQAGLLGILEDSYLEDSYPVETYLVAAYLGVAFLVVAFVRSS
tara:strand:- start:1509 stop:1799 length:291 start_codon:yes stop_codon:yes gene_type:complete